MRTRILAAVSTAACLAASGCAMPGADEPAESAAEVHERERLAKRYRASVRREKRRVLAVLRRMDAAGRSGDWPRVCGYYSAEARREVTTLLGSRTCAEGLSLAFSQLSRELGPAQLQAMMSVRPKRVRVRDDWAEVTYERYPRSVPEELRSFQQPTHLSKRRGRWRVAEI